jgi:hypothetical protein
MGWTSFSPIMPNWEYKIITSGSLGFGSLPLLEQHLNLLGKDEWEIIHFQTRPENPLAFNGLARRPVMRDWNVEMVPGAGMPSTKSGAIPAPPQERQADAPSVDELRAEAEERRESMLSREESLRPVGGTDTGADEDAATESAEEFDDEENDEDLPTFFEAIRPHMRRNLRGPGMAVGIDYLAKKFEQTEADLVEALKECGFTLPASAKDEPVYLEYDGDLYWLNLNHRGQLWINTREKPRAVFRPVHGQRVAPEAPPEEKPTREEQPTESAPPVEEVAPAPAAFESPASAAVEPPAQQQPARPVSSLPEGPALLDRLRPAMRRNRHGAGLSGSVSYLARAFRIEPRALVAAFEALGLVLPSRPSDKPVFVDIGTSVYWLNRDKTGQVWINTREKRDEVQPSPAGPPPESVPIVPESVPASPVPAPAAVEAPAETKPEAAAEAPVAAPLVDNPPSVDTPPSVPATGSPLAAVRLLLRETKRGGVAEELGRLADQLGQSTDNLLAALVGAGLQAPEKAREKPVFVEHAGEILWLNRNAKGQLWLNAKASKFAEKKEGGTPSGESPAPDEEPAAKRPRAPRRRR